MFGGDGWDGRFARLLWLHDWSCRCLLRDLAKELHPCLLIGISGRLLLDRHGFGMREVTLAALLAAGLAKVELAQRQLAVRIRRAGDVARR